jgi:hypothetical protein
MNARSFLWSIAFFVGLLAIFAGERLVAVGTGRTLLGALGAGLVALSLGVRAARLARAQGERRAAERLFLLLGAVIVLGLGLYAVQSDLWAKLAGVPLERSSPRLATVLSALWPAVLAVGLLPTFLAELAYAAMHRAPRVEVGRVRDAALSGTGLAAVLVFGFSAYYVASERDVKWDLSYFRTTRPGEATRNLVRALDEPVEVVAFFPPGNDVREAVVGYLEDLSRESGGQLEVTTLDHALEPRRARELGVTGNGTVALVRGERKELFGIGLELQRARGQLRTLDQEIHKRLLTLTRSRRTVYFTTGHGERTADRAGATDHRWNIRAVRELFSRQNHEVKNLGLTEGLGTDVPADAAAVVMVGPTVALLPEVEAALLRYLDRGGRLLLALDPEPDLTFEGLLSPHGLRYQPTVLANDQVFLTRTGAAAHRVNLLTSAYSSHPSVTTVGRLGQRATLVAVTAGALQQEEKLPEGVKVDITVRSHPQTFADANGNFEADPDEPRRMFGLGAAVSRTREGGPESRLVVLADSDALGDPVIENLGNAYVALDGLKWLLGEELLAGEVNTEEDVPVQHTRKQDVAWFYSTLFLVPGLVLAAGAFFSRGGRRKARKEVAR